MRNKKGITIISAFVGTIISLLVFFILFTYMKTTTDIISTQSDDLLCRALVSGKDFSKMGFGVYLFEIKQRCKVEEIKLVDLVSKDESFKKIADAMHRCWFRYGEGKHDFLSEWDTTGKWCFECGKITFKEGESSYSFEDFLEWSKLNKPSGKNMTYYEIISIRYGEVDEDEINGIREEYNDLIGNGNDEFTAPMFGLLAEQIEELQDLKIKTIDSTEDMFVVYRFDRIDKSYEEKLESATKGMIGGAILGIGGGLALEIVTETIVRTGAGFASGAVFAGVGAPVGAAIGFISSIVSGIKKVGTGIKDGYMIIEKVTKISKLSEKIGSKIRFSDKAGIALPELEKTTVVLGGKSFEAYEKIVKFSAEPKDLRSFASGIRAADSRTADNFDTIADLMDEFGIKNLDELDVKTIKLQSDKLKYEKIFDQTDGIYSEEALKKFTQADIELNNIDELIALSKSETAEFLAGNEVRLSATSYLIKLGVISGLGGVAGYMKEAYRNDNNVQYVDLMTQEQYYRMCGTERAIS